MYLLHCCSFRLGRLGDPGVSPPPRQGVVLAMVRTGLGTHIVASAIVTLKVLLEGRT